MSGGPKRNPDKLNTVGVVVIGICSAVLVYVAIVALQAFYMDDTSQIQTMADYGGNDTSVRDLRAKQRGVIEHYGVNPKPADPKPGEQPKQQTYRIPVELAMKAVVESAKADPSMLIPMQGKSDKSTVQPIFGRPKPLVLTPDSATCDEASCKTINFAGECCAKLKPPGTDTPAAPAPATPASTTPAPAAPAPAGPTPAAPTPPTRPGAR
ncbi:MAG: hypothetical protein AB7O24_22165 [Kofleriaceae bacterium]